MAEGVVVTLIAGGFTVVVALINKLLKENRLDHGIVHDSLNRIEQKVDWHIQNHDR